MGDMLAHLEHHIEQRTGGQIHCLRVETVGDRVIVRGYTDSYYVLQLVLTAVKEELEAFASEQLAQVELDIEVGGQQVMEQLTQARHPEGD